MSYVSLFKNIPDILSQPTGIAAIASIGIHGAIALIVPLMPVDSEPSQVTASPKSVGILELSQADQNRLPETPNTSPSQVSLQPALPQQPQLPPPNLDTQRTLLPPLPPPVYRQSVLPPNITSNYSIYPNRNVSLPQGLPIPAPAPAIAPRTAIVPAPAPAPEAIAPRQAIRFDPSGFNAANHRFAPSTRSFNQSEVRVATQALPVDRLPKVTPSQLPSDLPNTPPTTTTTNTTARTPRTGNDAAKTNANQELIARLQPTPQAQDKLVLANQSIPKWQPGSAPKTPELPLQKVNEPQGLIALNSYEAVRKEIQQAYPNSVEKPVIRETIIAKQPNVEGTVLGVLVVDPQGRVLDIKFQGESVSTDLQLKAREYFNARSPKGGEQISSYPFSLRFQNNGNTAETNQEQTPAASLRPLPQLRITNEQSAPASVVIPQPSTTPEANNNSLSSTLESGQKLIQQLRQVREERKDSSPQ
ncbi:hypothetical protein A2T98_12310 [Nodularia spumigena CENA596]|uniref:TonB C-terminal domain-containing protein n=1 Tax=Nodularia spumigena CENA596 TaxID=1819295 RepID=A0A166JC55_NODSP|nr:hypothetical protein [Nodularia spumigena]KZL49512.1 hypothetical protein A2T98_12310 [Nodularia spumigena CENA596]MDB9347996.1 hypothetical protein [Nodularia spumigena CS-588/01]MDB9352985.1 hypothetical protein [Nodularia spumigena CS-588/05]